MKPKISVIVPVYKVEQYLGRCVKSIMNQTYPNLEIILVDDGSPDNCGAICDEYAQKDMRIKVLHKENGGLSSARNAGLEIATGEYVGFVDSDDYILPQMYEKLYATLEANQADISICSFAYVDEQTGMIDMERKKWSPLRAERLTPKKAYQKINPAWSGYSFYVTAWNKLYKRKLFDQVRFKDGHIHEDEYSVHHIFSQCKCIAVIEDVLYMYVQRNGSITNTKASVKSLDAVCAFLDRYEFFLREGERELAADVLHATEWLLTFLLQKMKKTEEVEQIDKTVLIVLKTMIRSADIRAFRLIVVWLQYHLCRIFCKEE